MASKLGIHCLTPTLTAIDMIDAGVRVVKLVNDFGIAPYALGKGALVIGRHVTNYPDDPGRRVTAESLRHLDPRDAAGQWVNFQSQFYSANPLIKFWEGPNEPVWGTPDDMAWYAAFEIERMRLLENRGLLAVIGNFSTGNPGDLSLWAPFLPALRLAHSRGHYFGLHEYGGVWMWWMTGRYQINPAEDGGDEGWTTLRYRKIYRQFLIPDGIGNLPLVITECGLDAVHPPPPGFNSGHWRYCAEQWGRWDGSADPIDYWRGPEKDGEHYYAEQLKWYDAELGKDPYVFGATIFTLGTDNPAWDGFNIAGTRVASRLIDHIRNGGPMPNPPPTPTPTPEPTPTPAPTNLIANGDFEGGHYHWNNVPEIVIPNGFDFWHATASTPKLERQDQDFYPPETVVWNRNDAPPEERDLFFLNGVYCLKGFAGWKPIWWKLSQTVNNLTPGRRYIFTAPVFPDLAMRMEGGAKVWADDPLAGEVRLSASGVGVTMDTGYLNGSNFPFGRYTEHTLLFIAPAASVELSLECRGRWGLLNNGFFVDALRLEPIPEPTPSPVPGDLVAALEVVRDAIADAHEAMGVVFPEVQTVFTRLENARREAQEVVRALQ